MDATAGITPQQQNSGSQIHNIKLYDTETKITQLKSEIKDLFYKKKEIKDLSVKSNLKEGAQTIQQKGRAINTNIFTSTSCKRIRTIDRKRILGKSNRNRRRLLCEPRGNTIKEHKSIKIKQDSRNLNEVTIKRKAQTPNMEELISRISREISEGEDGEILATKLEVDYA